METDFGARRERRMRLLRALYGRTDADVRLYEDAHEIAVELGIDHDEVPRIIAYLEERGYVVATGATGATIRITADGIDRVESGG